MSSQTKPLKDLTELDICSKEAALPVMASAPDSLREIPPAAQRVGNDGVRLIRTGMPERVVLADIANAITNHGLTLDELRSLLSEDTKRLPVVPPARKRTFVGAVQYALGELETLHVRGETNGMADLRCLRDWLAELPTGRAPALSPEEPTK